MKTNRNVDYIHQMFILTGMKANIGPMRTFHFFKELVGSYDAVGCTSTDFKNYARDLRVFADGVDACILLDNLKNRQETCQDFKYFFDIDEDTKLSHLFWADEKAYHNFQRFGTAISFDATYGTNKFKMIFTPFTGKDNHGKCVTFGAAIITHEDVESYSWLLNKFVQCMGSHPKVLITDQDPALGKAIASVLPDTSHRLCMWHILMKVAKKLPPSLRDDSQLKNRFNNIVWLDIVEPEVFEQNWHDLIEEYDLGGNRWFTDMFEKRFYWVPTYFRDINMSGLFRTTSLSDSENNFFRRHLNKNGDLVQLYRYYVGAMEAQRNTYDTITMADETTVPEMCTLLPIERHAASIYTNKIFKDEVQEEIVAASATCVMVHMDKDGSMNYYDVDDTVHGVFKVSYNVVDDYLSCGCKLFTRKRYLCRHILFVMRTIKISTIPDKYIVQRWLKTSQVSGCSDEQLVTKAAMVRSSGGNNHFFLELVKSIGHVRDNNELRDQLFQDLKSISDKYSKLGLPIDSISKHDLFEQFYGSTIPDEIDVLPSNVVHIKGSGCGGRRKSNREKHAELALKHKRRCKKCNRLVNHDSRNCPRKDVDEE